MSLRVLEFPCPCVEFHDAACNTRSRACDDAVIRTRFAEGVAVESLWRVVMSPPGSEALVDATHDLLEAQNAMVASLWDEAIAWNAVYAARGLRS